MNDFVHLGAKGGSTAFVLNDAIYAENHNGDKIEIVILTDDPELLASNAHSDIIMNSFESKLLRSENYRLKVQKELSNRNSSKKSSSVEN